MFDGIRNLTACGSYSSCSAPKEFWLDADTNDYAHRMIEEMYGEETIKRLELSKRGAALFDRLGRGN